MGQVLVRNLEDDVIERLKRRAAADGLSLEEGLRRLLREAAGPTKEEILADLDRCRALTPPGPRVPSEELIREERETR